MQFVENTIPEQQPAVCLAEAARDAGLIYVTGAEPGVTRRRAGKGVTYRDAGGRRVADKATLKRIRALVIPPAWTDVWICADPCGHIQATGRDAKGRKQYKYHPDFRAVRETAKYDRLADFADALPHIRETVAAHTSLRGLPREKVLATIVHLLEATLIRVGNEDYAQQNESYGLTTLRDPHVEVAGSELRFDFTGKSGKTWRLKVKDRRVAKIVKNCQDLPGQQLFQYLDDDGERQGVSSADVNAYLRDITSQDITAKDFRTWGGTVAAVDALLKQPPCESAAAAKRCVKAAIDAVASRLGNTAAICRKCYVHPDVISAYLDGGLATALQHGRIADDEPHLKPRERAVKAFLKSRSKAD